MFEKRNTESSKAEKATAPAAEPSQPSGFSPTARSNSTKALIGPAIKISGDITGDEDLVVEGAVEGTINLPGHTVIIGKSGVVSANISASTVRIDGRVRGDILGAVKVILSVDGLTQGNIKAPRVILEEGAQFKGSIDMDPAADAAGKPAPAAKAPTNPTAKTPMNPAAHQPTQSPKREANPASAPKAPLG